MIGRIQDEKVLARIIFERDTMIEAMVQQIETMKQEIGRLTAEPPAGKKKEVGQPCQGQK